MWADLIFSNMRYRPLFDEFQPAGTVQLVPEVRITTVLVIAWVRRGTQKPASRPGTKTAEMILPGAVRNDFVEIQKWR
jgi:hypothetical protein